jgi:hypothetical protein
VVVEAEGEHDADQRHARADAYQHRPPTHRRGTPQDLAGRHTEGPTIAPCPQGDERGAGGAPRHEGDDGGAHGRRDDVREAITLRVCQMTAAVDEARIGALRAAIGQLDGLLDEEMGSERGGVGLLIHVAQMRQHRVEDTQDLRRVLRRRTLGGRRQARPVVQGIQEADQDVNPQHDERHHGDGTTPHPAPGRAQMLAAPGMEGECRHRRHQEEDQDIGPQGHQHVEASPQPLRRTRGSAKV